MAVTVLAFTGVLGGGVGGAWVGGGAATGSGSGEGKIAIWTVE